MPPRLVRSMREICRVRLVESCALGNRSYDRRSLILLKMRDEWTRYHVYPDLHDFEVLHARFIGHRFARHAHEYFVIGYVENGVQAYTYRGARHVTPPDHVFLVNPGEVHTGEAATDDGYVYRTMYPRIALMEQVVRDATGRRGLPLFGDAVVHDQMLSRVLTRLHREVAESGSLLAIESCLLSALRWLTRHHADDRVATSHVGRERTAVRRAREYLDAYFARDDVSLSRVSAVVGVSPFHLARAFEQEVGLPPHAYVEAVRITRARALLRRALPLAEVALAVGYADQSHFTHRFKRMMGISPGQYVRARASREP
jgi:AraC-like DNA-binding protein